MRLYFLLEVCVTAFTALHACAAAEATLYTFQGGTDGAYPKAGVVLASDGSLYGTTYGGGKNGCGTVFKIANGAKSTIYTFACGADGATPYAGVSLDSHGNIYGATEYGGTGFGVIYKVAPTGKEKVLHTFSGGADGAYPLAAPILDARGNLYGTAAGLTDSGPIDDNGTVFEIIAKGVYSVLYRCTGLTGGAFPVSTLVRDAKGNLFGTTNRGGAAGVGDVFRLSPSGQFSEIYAFPGAAGAPGLLFGMYEDNSRNLWAATYTGGANGVGSVFKVTQAGVKTDVYSFQDNGVDGRYPFGAGVTADSAGNLYGVTSGGGTGGIDGNGTVFKLTPTGAETVLYNFLGGTDGAGPWDVGALALDSAGSLYGTTVIGGTPGAGTVFKITP